MVEKSQVVGIHGTLHLSGSYSREEYFPAYREEDVANLHCTSITPNENVTGADYPSNGVSAAPTGKI
jgi:hypothetical protein